MGQYVTLEMTYSLYVDIIGHLQRCVKTMDEYYDIEDLIHTIDAVEELYEEDRRKRNAEFIREREYEKILGDQTLEDYKLGMLVVKEMDNLIGYEPFDSETFKFQNAMRVIDAIKEEYNIERKAPK